MVKYLAILSHCIVQLFEVGFCSPFQPEVLTDVVPFLSFLHPFYLHLLELLYCQVMPPFLFFDAILGQPRKQVRTANSHFRCVPDASHFRH